MFQWIQTTTQIWFRTKLYKNKSSSGSSSAAGGSPAKKPKQSGLRGRRLSPREYAYAMEATQRPDDMGEESDDKEDDPDFVLEVHGNSLLVAASSHIGTPKHSARLPYKPY